VRLTAGDTTLHCVRTGAGAPAIVLHGGPGFDHTYLRDGLDPLGRFLELLYVDQRGQGRSARPVPLDQLTVDTWAEDVERVRQALGLNRIVLFGHSFGALIALEYATRHPDALLALVVCSGAARVDLAAAAERLRGVAPPELMGKFLTALAAPVPDDDTLGQSYCDLLPLYLVQRSPSITRAFRRVAYSASAFNCGTFQELAAFDVRGRLRHVAVPALVLVGRHDWLTSVGDAELLCHELPDATLSVFEHSAHYPFLEEREPLVNAASGWLRDRVTAIG
jgi:proline iminopeptidase